MRRYEIFVAVALSLFAGCRLLETGYGDDNVAVRSSVKSVSETTDAAKSAVAWTGARVLSFADDLEPGQHRRFIEIGELAASAYRASPELPKGCRPLSKDEFAALGISPDRYVYEQESGFLEDAGGVGFGARLLRRESDDGVVVAFRGSNAPGEDEHWMHDWVVDVHQGGGGIPQQYVYGSEVLSSVRKTFPDKELVVTGHSLGGGIAAYSTIQLGDPGRLVCATYNAAGISSITLLSLPKDAVSGAAGRISNIRSKGDPVSAIPGTQLVGEIYEVDNLRFANHAIEGLLIDMRRRAEGRKAGWLRDLFDD
jgi:hypothetical protein